MTFALRQAELRQRPINFVVSDGRGYYVFLPSIFIDHTLDFTNQIRRHWDEDFDPALLDRRTERGYIKSRYTIGMALTISPAFLTAHAMSQLVYPRTGDALFAPDGYSPVYQLCVFAFILAIGWLTMLVIDRLLVNHFGVRPMAAMAGVVVFWIGSHYAWYYYREPVMVHVVSTFWVTVAIFLSAELMEDAACARRRALTHLPRLAAPLAGRVARLGSTPQNFRATRLASEAANRGEWQDGISHVQGRQASALRWWLPPMLALATSMAILCRPTNLFILPILLLVAWRLARAGLLARAILKTPWPLGILPLILQTWICHRMTGHLISNGYAKNEGFNWTRPALWQTLFSTRHGLFVWSPLLILAVVGVMWRLHGSERSDRARGEGENRPLLLCLCLAALLLWYVNSAWRDWWFGWAFGNRAFLELAVLFCLGLACLFEQLAAAKTSTRRIVVYACSLTVLYNYVLMSLYAARYIPPDGYWF